MQLRKALLAVVLLTVVASLAQGCPVCRPQVRASVYGERFVGTLLTVLLPLGAIVTIVAGVSLFDKPIVRGEDVRGA